MVAVFEGDQFTKLYVLFQMWTHIISVLSVMGLCGDATVAYMYLTVHSLAVIKQNVKYNLMSCTARRNKSPRSSVWVEQWLQWIKKHEISEAVVLLEDKYPGIPWFSLLSLNTYSHGVIVLQYGWGSAISSSWQRPQTVCATDSLCVVTIVTGI